MIRDIGVAYTSMYAAAESQRQRLQRAAHARDKVFRGPNPVIGSSWKDVPAPVGMSDISRFETELNRHACCAQISHDMCSKRVEPALTIAKHPVRRESYAVVSRLNTPLVELIVSHIDNRKTGLHRRSTCGM